MSEINARVMADEPHTENFETSMTLDRIIDPEIHSQTTTYQAIMDVIQKESISTILEIGASSGEGTTEAIVNGVLKSGRSVQVASIEVSKGRFARLKARYEEHDWFHPYNVSSLPLSSFPSKDEISTFVPTNALLQPNSVSTVLAWYQSDIDYIQDAKIPQNGIQQIKTDFQVETFDMVVIDGSEFLGNKEFEALPNAKVYVLDDIFAYKNWYSHQSLMSNPNYTCFFLERIRGGSSIFVRNS